MFQKNYFFIIINIKNKLNEATSQLEIIEKLPPEVIAEAKKKIEEEKNEKSKHS